MNLNIGNQTILQMPVQSEADVEGATTLPEGDYTGRVETSPSYTDAIKISGNGYSEDQNFLIHPNQFTTKERIKKNIKYKWINPTGPWGVSQDNPNGKPHSRGCQTVLGIENYNNLINHLRGIGFETPSERVNIQIRQESNFSTEYNRTRSLDERRNQMEGIYNER